MAIQLINRYHVIKSLLDEHNDDMKKKGHQMIQRVVAGEFLVVLYVKSLYTV